jgi:ElaB/YqjD/DUF883 family membrane-anchored ribosome-binding protein
MVGIHTSNGALRRNTKRLAKGVKRTSRDFKHSAERAADEATQRAQALSKAAGRSMKKHPVAWTSATLGAAAVAGLLVMRRVGREA